MHTLTGTLQKILHKVVAERVDEPRRLPAEILPTVSFAELGVNSVDLLEFVLRLEQELDVRVLDDMLPDELPSTLAGWADVVTNQQKKSAA